MAEVKQHTLNVAGTGLSVFEWGQAGGHQVMLAHATGFHARCWDQVIAKLPEDWHIFAIDARGHGRSENKAPYSWARFAQDLSGVMMQLGITGATGVGHSMGGHCVAHVCALHSHLFTRLVLIDPVILSPELYAQEQLESSEQPQDHPVARRRSHFANWHEMFDRYKGRAPYSLWETQIFKDYCQYGVVPSADGNGVDLCCSGIVEAQVYMENQATNIYPLLANIDQPVTILRAPPSNADTAEMDFSASPTPPQLVHAFKNAKDIYLPHLTHFIPMQDSELVSQAIVNA